MATMTTMPNYTIQRSITAILANEPIVAYRAWSENTTGAGRGARRGMRPRPTIEEAMADLASLKSTDNSAIGHRYSIETMDESTHNAWLDWLADEFYWKFAE